MVSAGEKFMELYYLSDKNTDKAKYYDAVEQWEAKYSFKPQYTSYLSFKNMQHRLIKKQKVKID